MKVTLVQTELFWEDPKKNLAHFDRLLASLKEKTDLIVLPEMFTTGFSMEPERVAEAHKTTTYDWLLNKARQLNAIITGSVAVHEAGQYYNRLHWAQPDGHCSFYDKRHLFRLAGEEKKYTAGKEKIIKQVGEWKIMPLVCYDLRFPVWSRNFIEQRPQYDVLIYIANWPTVRSYPWKQLLIARAIENQCYVIGLNRVGKDGNGYEHSGDSMVINPRGEIISHTNSNAESMETVELDRSYLEEFRKVFPVGLDSDNFQLL
jgi:omega-amidase